MSGAQLFEGIARIARHEVAARPTLAAATVTAVFAHEATPDHAVSVQLRDTGLVLLRVPVAVGTLGYAAIPAVGDLVVVAFLEGDFDAPFVVGRLYHPDLDPPKHKPGQMALRLPAGEDSPKLELEVEGDAARVMLKLPGDVQIEVIEESIKLAVGKIEISLTAKGGGRLEAKAGGASLTIKEDGDIAMKTSGKLSLEGSDVEIKGSGKVKVSAAMIELN
ncbi:MULTISPECIES: phage baseplate assembly protein V [unclassified Sphingomonas]|nr:MULTISPECIES: phage baseplate assembly protein V [unclassified Sphingomonas]